LDREEEALYVAVEDAVEVLFINRAKGSVGRDTGVGEDDIEFPFFFPDLCEEAIEVFKIGYVALNGGDVGADFFDRRVKFGLGAAGDEDLGAFADEPFGGGATDAAIAACDEWDFAVELAHSSLRVSFCVPRSRCCVFSRDAFQRSERVEGAASLCAQVVEEGLHLAGGVGVVRALRGGKAVVQAHDGFLRAA
jgi:hypothetical protein